MAISCKVPLTCCECRYPISKGDRVFKLTGKRIACEVCIETRNAALDDAEAIFFDPTEDIDNWETYYP